MNVVKWFSLVVMLIMGTVQLLLNGDDEKPAMLLSRAFVGIALLAAANYLAGFWGA